MKRNLILVPLDKSGEYHAPKYSKRDQIASPKTIERLNNRLYEIRDADTWELLETVAI